jgi:hypothetical protein
MKLSNETLTVLKNFAGINQSILVRKGNKLRTMSVMKTVLAEAVVNEEFEKELIQFEGYVPVILFFLLKKLVI